MCVDVWQPMPCVYTYRTVWYLSVVDCLSWTLRSSVFSTTVQTVAPHKTASPAPSSWNMSPRWAVFAALTTTRSQFVLVHGFEHSLCVCVCVCVCDHVIPGDACDRRSSQPSGRPSFLGGLSAQPRQEASGGWSQHRGICCMINLS